MDNDRREKGKIMWMQVYVERAVLVSCMPWDSQGRAVAWDALQDDILGKLSLQECAMLYKHCEAVPSVGSLLIRSIMP